MTIETYLTLPTLKSDRPSEKYALFLRHHYNIMAQKDLNLVNIIHYIQDVQLANSSKAVLAMGLSRYFADSQILTAKEVERLKRAFPQGNNHWSSKHIDDEKLLALINHSYSNSKGFIKARNHVIFLFLSSFGMRAEQLLHLRCSAIAVDYDKHLIKANVLIQKQRNMYREEKHTEIYANYTHNIGQYNLLDAYNDYMTHIPDDGFFILDKTKNVMSYHSLNIMFKRFSKAINIPITPHSLRHYLAHKIVATHGLAVANAQLNHASMDTTRRYINRESLLENALSSK